MNREALCAGDWRVLVDCFSCGKQRVQSPLGANVQTFLQINMAQIPLHRDSRAWRPIHTEGFVPHWGLGNNSADSVPRMLRYGYVPGS